MVLKVKRKVETILTGNYIFNGTNLILLSRKQEIRYLSTAAIQRWKNVSDRSIESAPSPIAGSPEEIQHSYLGVAYCQNYRRLKNLIL